MPAKVEILVPVISQPGALREESAYGQSKSWWLDYRSRLSNLSSAAKKILEGSSDRIASAAMPLSSAAELDQSAWDSTRVRKGLVVGSVQSGKTASMLGVCAFLLDRRVSIIVVLAGTRVALWMQTLERMLEKLDGSTPTTAWKRTSIRALVPEPEDILNELGRLPARKYLPSRRPAATKAIRLGLPLIVVVPKEDDHLIELAKFLREVCPDALLDSRDRPLSMVVLDDEADDASVLDAADQGRVTPQHIQRLWSERASGESTRHQKLFATYVAYTATPQANFLQRTHNPLAPRDFHVALQVPLDRGGEGSSTFLEPAGVESFYCGGEIFYERYREMPGDFCLATPPPTRKAEETAEGFEARFNEERNSLLGDALRAYFVGGALRLLLSSRQLSAVSDGLSRPLPSLRDLLPAPHSMLFHPSALRDEHFEGAEQIARWSNEILGLPPIADSDGVPQLSVVGLSKRLDAEENLWKRWVDEYAQSSGVLNLLPGAKFQSVSSRDWPLIKNILISEVFVHTKLRVLNSDERADDRPQFEPLPDDSVAGTFRTPPDIYTIFVAGNVLSRGLTVDGLCTSVFLRSSGEPAADTQMQMQRWFGYRGRHLPFCRIFLFSDQLSLFQKYHANDEALKTEILRRGADIDGRSGALVLQGDNFKATSKVDSRRAPLHPGAAPAIRLVENENSSYARSNLDIVGTLTESGTWGLIEEPKNTVRGLILKEPLGMLEVAAVLDKFRYQRHQPNASEELFSRWSQLETLLGLKSSLFQPPFKDGVGSFVEPAGCPYSIAAYLRLWNEMLSIRTAHGLYPTDAPKLPWSSIDLPEYRRTAPQFFVAIRFGDEGEVADKRLADLGVKAVHRSTRVPDGPTIKALWGTRGVGGTYFGDQMLDYHFHQTKPVPRLHQEPIWRPRGHPGLLLFYIAKTRLGDQPLFGLGLPHGGPDHIAALRTSVQA